MSNYQPLYAIDAAELDDERVDVRLTAPDGTTATRTFDADYALYGADGGDALADWIAAVVRDLFAQTNGAAATDDQTRWTEPR